MCDNTEVLGVILNRAWRSVRLAHHHPITVQVYLDRINMRLMIGDEFQSLCSPDAPRCPEWIHAVTYQRGMKLDVALRQVLRTSIRAMYFWTDDLSCEGHHGLDILFHALELDLTARLSHVGRSHLNSVVRFCSSFRAGGTPRAELFQQGSDFKSVEDVAETQSLCSDALARCDLWRLSLVSLGFVRRAAARKFKKPVNILQQITTALLCSQIDRAIGNLFLQLGSVSSAEHAYSSGLRWLHVSAGLLERMQSEKLEQCKATIESVLVDASGGALSRYLVDFACNGRVNVEIMGLLGCGTRQNDAVKGMSPARASLSSLVDATNNVALGALSHCHVDRAVAVLEAAVKADPVKYMSDAVVFNLCTLYDLRYDNAEANAHKHALQVLAEAKPLRQWYNAVECP